MATSSSSSMQSSSVVLLLLSAVVASQGHQVPCKNTCKRPIAVNGISIAPGKTTVMVMTRVVEVEACDSKGVKHVGKYMCPEDGKVVKHVGKYKCPEDVKSLEIVCVEGLGTAHNTETNGVGSTSNFEPPVVEVNIELEEDPTGLSDKLEVVEGMTFSRVEP